MNKILPLFILFSCSQEPIRLDPIQLGLSNVANNPLRSVESNSNSLVSQWSLANTTNKLSCFQNLPNFYFLDTSQFSVGNAILLTQLYHFDYSQTQAQTSQMLENWGFSPPTFFEDSQSGIYGLVANQGKITLVYFRGTFNLSGLSTDSGFLTTSASSLNLAGYVHSGFLTSFNQIQLQLEPTLAKFSDSTFYFMGHSLGAAQTTIAATQSQKKGRKIGAVYAFGQPRIGDVDFANSVAQVLGTNYYRVTFGNNLITHIPPHPNSATTFAKILSNLGGTIQTVATLLIQQLNYAHSGTEHVFPLSGQATTQEEDGNRDNQFWQQVSTQVKSPADLLNLPAVNDHTSEAGICTLANQR